MSATPPTPAWDARFCAKSPLFWPIRAAAEVFSTFDAWPAVEDYDRALGAGAPVRFVAQPPRPRRRARRPPVDAAALYDGRIHLEGRVPTRARCWHDFLNMLVWAAFPRAKRALHARQHRAVAARVEPGARALPGRRTRELDGLAILDEGGLLLLCDDDAAAPVAEALGRGAAEAAHGAIAGGRAAALIFGHALYEHLVQGGQTIYAMVHALPCGGPLPAQDADRVALADARLAEALRDAESFTDPARFAKLPVDARLAGGG